MKRTYWEKIASTYGDEIFSVSKTVFSLANKIL
jgi:hypothetical protein